MKENTKKSKKIISITGIPGTGKTEVSEELSKLIDLKIITSEDLDMEKYYDTKRQCFVLDVILLKKSLLKKLEEKKYEKGVIFDSHLSHLLPKEFVKYCFILRCEPKQLKLRLEKRGYSKEKIRENVEAEIVDLLLVEAISKKHKIHEINTTHKTPKETAKEVYQVLTGKRKNSYGNIDFVNHVSDTLS